MSLLAKARQFSKLHLAALLGVDIILQPFVDILTALGARAEMSATVGAVIRAVFMILCFLYVVFICKYPGKKWCVLALGVICAYLAVFMLWMFSVGGLSLCIANAKELAKVYFAPIAVVFLYAIYREYGHMISTRAIAIAGGIYVGVILVAFLTGTSFVSYSNSGYGYKGWFYAANEVSCIIAIASPITIYYCLKQLPSVTRKTWWKGALIAFTLVSVVVAANFIGTKIAFGITLIYCLIASVWGVVMYAKRRTAEYRMRMFIFIALTVCIFVLYFFSPLQSYMSNIYMKLLHRDPELIMASWSKEIQEASRGTWLRALIDNNELVQSIDQILSRRLLSASPSVQVFLDGGLMTKLFGTGYANTEAYGRSIEFMIEIDPLGILIRQGVVGFILYFIPYAAFIVYAAVQFFRRPGQRLGSLKYCSYLYSTLAAFGISVIAGHALVSPAVSTFMVVISFNLWVYTREQNKLPRTDKGA